MTCRLDPESRRHVEELFPLVVSVSFPALASLTTENVVPRRGEITTTSLDGKIVLFDVEKKVFVGGDFLSSPHPTVPVTTTTVTTNTRPRSIAEDADKSFVATPLAPFEVDHIGNVFDGNFVPVHVLDAKSGNISEIIGVDAEVVSSVLEGRERIEGDFLFDEGIVITDDVSNVFDDITEVFRVFVKKHISRKRRDIFERVHGVLRSRLVP